MMKDKAHHFDRLTKRLFHKKSILKEGVGPPAGWLGPSSQQENASGHVAASGRRCEKRWR